MADLYLVRHGQTELNVQNILQGGHDSPLTARGREQALATRAAFEARGVTFDRVYSSPLGRARRTSASNVSRPSFSQPCFDIDSALDGAAGTVSFIGTPNFGQLFLGKSNLKRRQ